MEKLRICESGVMVWDMVRICGAVKVRLTQQEMQILSKMPKGEFRVFVCRELLRSIEAIGENFRSENAGWLFFEQFSYLRLINVAVVSVKFPDQPLLEEFKSAFAAVNKHRLSGSDSIVAAAQDALNLIPPVDQMPASRTADTVKACLLWEVSHPDEQLGQRWAFAAKHDISDRQNRSLHFPIFGPLTDFRFSEALRAFKTETTFGSYWFDWYRSFIEGRPLDWELQLRVATIKSDVWDAGPEAVAERIQEILKDFERTPLNQDALHAHVHQLSQNPVLHADIAESAGLQIEAAIQAFKTEAPANQLPDGFAAFETLAPTFLNISATLSVPSGTTPDTVALQEEINRLHSVIEELRSDLRDAHTRLSDARLTALEAQQLRTFGERLTTTLTNITLLGTIGMGTAWFFGVPAEDLKYEALKDALQGLSTEMENAQPAPQGPTLPETTDV